MKKKWDRELRNELMEKGLGKEVIIHFQSGGSIKGKIEIEIQKRKIFINGTPIEEPVGFYRFLS